LAETEAAVVRGEFGRERVGDAPHSADHRDWSGVEIRSLSAPLIDECRDAIACGHAAIIVSAQTIMISMETKTRWVRAWRRVRWPLVTSIGPVVFGTAFFVTHDYLPVDVLQMGQSYLATRA